CGVGNWDRLVRTGQIAVVQQLPLTLGAELSGVIESLGSAVSPLEIGQPVFGSTNPSFTGAYAEAAVAKASMLARQPRRLSDIESASVPVVAVTALQMVLEIARVAPGETVMVLGGAGNVGAYAVQLARRAGGKVAALVKPRDVTEAKALGASDLFLNLPASSK